MRTLEVSDGATPGVGGRMHEWRAMVGVLHSRPNRHTKRQTMGGLVRAAVDDVVTTIFPGDCRACGSPLVQASVVPVCGECLARVRRRAATSQEQSMCFQCGEALEMESVRFAGQFAEGLICHACGLVPPTFTRAVAYAEYRDELREIIHLLKYERMRGAAGVLGGMLAEAVLTLEGTAAAALTVVAVPLYPAKQRLRGYNQSELLADAAIASLRRVRPDWKLRRDRSLLRRVRDTESQFGLSAKGRRRNLEGAFAADASRIVPGCEVLLVDDIYTTGATARQCAGVLRRAGAGKVWVATLARAQVVRVEMWDGEVGEVVGFGSEQRK